MVTYAAFSPEYRGKGYILGALEYMNSYLQKKMQTNIVGVQLNPTDDKAIWQHLGFSDLQVMQSGQEVLIVEK